MYVLANWLARYCVAYIAGNYMKLNRASLTVVIHWIAPSSPGKVHLKTGEAAVDGRPGKLRGESVATSF